MLFYHIMLYYSDITTPDSKRRKAHSMKSTMAMNYMSVR